MTEKQTSIIRVTDTYHSVIGEKVEEIIKGNVPQQSGEHAALWAAYARYFVQNSAFDIYCKVSSCEVILVPVCDVPWDSFFDKGVNCFYWVQAIKRGGNVNKTSKCK